MNRIFPSGRRGFTLVELLVVIAIVLILVSIGVPGLRRYRRIGLAQRCIANIRTIQHARESYFYDHPTATQINYDDELNPYLPLNLSATGSAAEKFNSFTCAGKFPYQYGKLLTDLRTLPKCPNLSNTSTEIANEYGEHTIVE